MRGRVNRQTAMFVAYNVEDRIAADHPLRRVKRWADRILQDMRRDFDAAYAKTGRAGIPPEQLLKALLLRALFSISSERRLMEAIEFNLLYRWFVDLPPDAPTWSVKVFCMNRDRFTAHDLVRKFFDRVVIDAMKRDLVSNDHFTVDGTLIRSWASHKSIRPVATAPGSDASADEPKDDDPPSGGRDVPADWRGERRSNRTHRSTTDPEARLARKGNGREAHPLIEMDARITAAAYNLLAKIRAKIRGCEDKGMSTYSGAEAGMHMLCRWLPMCSACARVAPWAQA